MLIHFSQVTGPRLRKKDVYAILSSYLHVPKKNLIKKGNYREISLCAHFKLEVFYIKYTYIGH